MSVLFSPRPARSYVSSRNLQVRQRLQTEQKRVDFRPSEEFPPALDQATEACCLVSSLLAAVLKEASQTLQAANLISFNVEAGFILHKFVSNQ